MEPRREAELVNSHSPVSLKGTWITSGVFQQGHVSIFGMMNPFVGPHAFHKLDSQCP